MNNARPRANNYLFHACMWVCVCVFAPFLPFLSSYFFSFCLHNLNTYRTYPKKSRQQKESEMKWHKPPWTNLQIHKLIWFMLIYLPTFAYDFFCLFIESYYYRCLQQLTIYRSGRCVCSFRKTLGTFSSFQNFIQKKKINFNLWLATNL